MAGVEVESRPATQDELKTLRRWVVVAGVWAVAATVVALIALLDDSGRAAERRAVQTGARVAQAEERLDRRLDRVEARLGQLPSSAQVQALRTQVGQAQRSASGAATSARTASRDVSALEDRVSDLESNGGSDSGDEPGGDVPRLRDLLP